MKRIFTSRSLTEVDFVMSLLGGEGIQAFVRNEFGAHTAGGGFGSMAFTWPELWVSDEDEHQALTLVAEFKLRRQFGTPIESPDE